MHKVIKEINSDLLNLKVHRVAKGIYSVVIPDAYERCMLFMRAQEYYETPLKEFNGKTFDLFEFMNAYRKKFGSKVTCDYTKHWAGFNVPSESIEKCYKQLCQMDNQKYMTVYDWEMLVILKAIRQHQPKGKFYLIGVDSERSGIMKHELAHAFYYTNMDYKAEMMSAIVTNMTEDCRNKFNHALKLLGYEEKVYMDETQAFLSTGLHVTMNRVPRVKTLSKIFSKIYKQYYNELHKTK